MNQYGAALSGLSQEQIDQIRQAAQDVYGQGYRLTGSSGGAGGSLGEFMYGNAIPGYSDEEIYAAAQHAAPEGGKATPMHVMQNGQVEVRNGVPGIYGKYQQSDGLNTIWIPLGAPVGSDQPQAPAE